MEVGILAKPHGLHGEFLFKSHSGSLNAVPVGGHVRLLLRDGQQQDALLAAVRPFKTGGLIRLEGVGPDAVERLRGATLSVQRADLGELKAGEVYITDLVGLRALMPDGKPAGTIKDAVDTRPYITLIVDGPFSGTVPYHHDWVDDPDFSTGVLRLRRPPIC